MPKSIYNLMIVTQKVKNDLTSQIQILTNSYVV